GGVSTAKALCLSITCALALTTSYVPTARALDARTCSRPSLRPSRVLIGEIPTAAGKNAGGVDTAVDERGDFAWTVQGLPPGQPRLFVYDASSGQVRSAASAHLNSSRRIGRIALSK